MSYTILDAIRDEVELLKEMEKWAKDGKKTISESIYYTTRCSLQHILVRMEDGVDIYLDKTGSSPTIRSTRPVRKTDAMLEKENVALKKAAENYNLIRALVSDEITKEET